MNTLPCTSHGSHHHTPQVFDPHDWQVGGRLLCTAIPPYQQRYVTVRVVACHRNVQPTARQHKVAEVACCRPREGTDGVRRSPLLVNHKKKRWMRGRCHVPRYFVNSRLHLTVEFMLMCVIPMTHNHNEGFDTSSGFLGSGEDHFNQRSDGAACAVDFWKNSAPDHRNGIVCRYYSY